MTGDGYTPALGTHLLTPIYDLAVALLTSERTWRSKFLHQISPVDGDRIVDVGCGTGSLAIMLILSEPGARITGIDPDPLVLERARRKASKTGAEISWKEGFLTDTLTKQLHPVTKVISSLVFHQTPMAEKRHILNNMYHLLQPGGELHIADYGLQRSRLMRILFRWTVQVIDGVEDTQPNADGVLPQLIESAGFTEVVETEVVSTLTGAISLYRAVRPTVAR